MAINTLLEKEICKVVKYQNNPKYEVFGFSFGFTALFKGMDYGNIPLPDSQSSKGSVSRSK